MSSLLDATASVGELAMQRILYNVESCWLYLNHHTVVIFIILPKTALNLISEDKCKMKNLT
jgi:hypothetical protein